MTQTKLSRATKGKTQRRRSTLPKQDLSIMLNHRQACDVLDRLGIVSITDVNGAITYANEEFLRISGYSRKELIGQNHRILNSGYHKPDFFRNMYATIKVGELWRGRIRNRRKDGSHYWVDALIVPMRGLDGAIIAYCSVRLDITATVETEIESLQRRYQLQAVLDHFPGGIAVYDRDLRLVVCNERQKEILDLPDSLFKNRMPTLKELFEFNAARGEYGDGDVDTLVALRMKRAQTLEPHCVERARPNGKILEIRGAPLPDGGFVSTHIDITERKSDQLKIEALAQQDALTGLANRRLLLDRLEVATARSMRGDHIALHYLDLDRFKSINDTLGHLVGDTLLQQVANRLRANTRETDTVARLGGDEFAILQVGLKTPEDAAQLAARITEVIGAPYELGNSTISIGASIGIALAPEDATDPIHLLRKADMALYQSKQGGRGTYRFFEPEMDARVRARCLIESGLKQALQREEFELHYQPIVSTADRSIVGCEALLRWHHPQNGYISPADFVSVAEETGLIASIGDWVLKKACLDALSWPAHISVAVNISPVQFRSRDLYGLVLSSLGDLNPSRLVLEITETSLMQDSEATLMTMERIRQLGVRFSLDDFGTGYSSLSYLQRYPFDKVKIDRSFVSETSNAERSNAVVSAIASLGCALKMTTLAEGVETEQQFRNVVAQGCSEAQGYLFARALPAQHIKRLLNPRTTHL